MILALLGTVFVWWRYLSIGGAPAATETVPDEFENELAEIRRLKDLKLDTGILQDDFFKSLEAPPVVDVTNVQTGRENPFLPF